VLHPKFGCLPRLFLITHHTTQPTHHRNTRSLSLALSLGLSVSPSCPSRCLLSSVTNARVARAPKTRTTRTRRSVDTNIVLASPSSLLLCHALRHRSLLRWTLTPRHHRAWQIHLTTTASSTASVRPAIWTRRHFHHRQCIVVCRFHHMRLRHLQATTIKMITPMAINSPPLQQPPPLLLVHRRTTPMALPTMAMTISKK
jgi:hypothetical protein